MRFWDLRSNTVDTTLLPQETPAKTSAPRHKAARKWVNTLALNDGEDWLLCGGGALVSLWHLKSNTKTTTFKTAEHFQVASVGFTKYVCPHTHTHTHTQTCARARFWLSLPAS